MNCCKLIGANAGMYDVPQKQSRPLGRLSVFRYKLSIALEIALWLVTAAWCLWLAKDVKDTGSLRSLFEFVLLGLLVWWPLIRTRIQGGYWP